jgi:hypothetical protein
MALSLNTSIRDEFGREVVSRRVIVRRYLGSYFLTDLLSLLPLGTLVVAVRLVSFIVSSVARCSQTTSPMTRRTFQGSFVSHGRRDCCACSACSACSSTSRCCGAGACADASSDSDSVAVASFAGWRRTRA